MGKKYRNSIDFFRRRQNRIQRHKLKRKNKKHNIYNYHNDVRPFFPKQPKELDLLSTKKQEQGNEFIIELPSSFSITNNPNITIKVLKRIANLFNNQNDLNITVLCNNTIDIDMSALIILDMIIVRGTRYVVKKGHKCMINGNLPDNPQMRELFIYSGLPKHLNLLNNEIDNPYIEILDPFCVKKDSNLETQRIIEYYDSCLKKNGYQLNNKGKIYFYKLINEIVDNAKIHNGIDGLYYCGGFYSDFTKKGQLSIISFGNSMFESLSGETTDISIKNKINKYIKSQKKFFDINYDEETSWTVYALQYKISRYNNKSNPDRGTGTIQFMNAFMQMGKSVNSNPKMSLMSGNTHILFDGKYNLKEENINGEMIPIIAFNDNNDLSEKPNKNYVKHIEEKFPGVIINIEFFVDKEYLIRFKEENNE